MKRLILTICIALLTLTGLAQRNGQYPGLGGGGGGGGGSGITNGQSNVTLTGQFLATGIYNNLTNVLSANYQILTSNIAVFGGGNPGGAAQVITLPLTPNFTNNYGAYWWIFCTNASGSIIVTNANGTELINGATSLTISGISSINLQSDMNSNYWTVGNPFVNTVGTITDSNVLDTLYQVTNSTGAAAKVLYSNNIVTVHTHPEIYSFSYSDGANGLSNNAVTGGSIFIPHLNMTTIQTNFIGGFLYTNNTGATIYVSANVFLVPAAVAGSARQSLLAPGYQTNTYSVQTLVTTLVMDTTNNIGMWIPAGQGYEFTNMSAGAGDSSGVLQGTILIP